MQQPGEHDVRSRPAMSHGPGQSSINRQAVLMRDEATEGYPIDLLPEEGTETLDRVPGGPKLARTPPPGAAMPQSIKVCNSSCPRR